MKFPSIPKDLLDELERRFPDRMPMFGIGSDVVCFKQGQVSVIQFLKAQFEIQNHNILETK